MVKKVHTFAYGDSVPSQTHAGRSGYCHTEGTQILVWYDFSKRAWFSAEDGCDSDGNWGTSDDYGPFTSKREAYEEVKSVLDEAAEQARIDEDRYESLCGEE
jgi:hypothetical protein